jgi:hypothetical protein
MKAVSALLLSALVGGLLASAPAAPAETREATGFSLIPNAFTKNPLLSMTVFTEMTAYGRNWRPATPDAPVSFVAVDRGMHTMGEAISGVISPPPEAFRDILLRALAGGGYVPVPADQPAGLVLFYFWGSHYGMDLDQALMFPELNDLQILERAMLVGGRRYQLQILNEMDFGHTFADRTAKKRFLITQATDDLYFVVVSAYDYREVAANQPRLLWRTTMTVGTNGVSMKDTLPPLVMTASPYFGRDMPEPLALHRRARRGTVTLGPLNIVEGAAMTPSSRHER